MSDSPLPSTRYSDAELTCMMADLESDLVERKESLRGDAPVKIRQAVCAFANDLPDHRRPGVVFVGARRRRRSTRAAWRSRTNSCCSSPM